MLTKLCAAEDEYALAIQKITEHEKDKLRKTKHGIHENMEEYVELWTSVQGDVFDIAQEHARASHRVRTEVVQPLEEFINQMNIREADISRRFTQFQMDYSKSDAQVRSSRRKLVNAVKAAKSAHQSAEANKGKPDKVGAGQRLMGKIRNVTGTTSDDLRSKCLLASVKYQDTIQLENNQQKRYIYEFLPK